MKLTNLSRTPLGIPRNPMLLPGQSMSCKHWDEVRNNRIVASWIDSGALAVEEVAETVEPPPAPVQEPAPEPEAAEEEQESETESDDDDILGEKSEQPATRRRRRSK